MVQFIPPPDPRGLLSPLLACFPSAFASSRPPPALLPLLSPILRQRVQLLSSNASTSSGSWVPLLCWDQQRASKLPSIIQSIQLEPHPVSGEIELSEVEDIRYRRLDEETLHARLELSELDLLAVYLWCENDAAGADNGWRLAELRPLADTEDGTQWHGSMTEANERSRESYIRKALGAAGASATNGSSGSNGRVPPGQEQAKDAGEDDDDAYWAAYDRTPGRTPAKRSPAPRNNSTVQLPSTSELEYFARYVAEVQPAMDPHDPSEDGVAPGESTLNGDELSRTRPAPQVEPTKLNNVDPEDHGPAQPPPYADNHKDVAETEQATNTKVNHPRPKSPASSVSSSVDRLEQTAVTQTQAELGIKQHISTDIKSLFRLARSAGIERDEFERIVRTELEVLAMIDMDE